MTQSQVLKALWRDLDTQFPLGFGHQQTTFTGWVHGMRGLHTMRYHWAGGTGSEEQPCEPWVSSPDFTELFRNKVQTSKSLHGNFRHPSASFLTRVMCRRLMMVVICSMSHGTVGRKGKAFILYNIQGTCNKVVHWQQNISLPEILFFLIIDNLTFARSPYYRVQ